MVCTKINLVNRRVCLVRLASSADLLLPRFLIPNPVQLDHIAQMALHLARSSYVPMALLATFLVLVHYPTVFLVQLATTAILLVSHSLDPCAQQDISVFREQLLPLPPTMSLVAFVRLGIIVWLAQSLLLLVLFQHTILIQAQLVCLRA